METKLATQSNFSHARSILWILALASLATAFPAQADDVEFGFAVGMGGFTTDEGNAIAVDASGNVYTTGFFDGTVDFDPGAGTVNLISAGTGGGDVFVQKLDSIGSLVWAKAMGGTGIDRGYGIAVDDSGNVYTTGYFAGTVDFDPGAGTANLTSVGGDDIFVQKLDSSGALVWARAMGGTGTDEGLGITVDTSGNVHITGSFQGTVDFDPGAGTVNLTGVDLSDIFVEKLNPAGEFVWAKIVGGGGSNFGQAIALDGSGNVYTTGSFEATADFDPGAGTLDLTSVGAEDVFVQKLDSSGNFVWAKAVGGTDTDEGYGIAVDVSGDVYTTGNFEDTADFDPGAGTANLSSVGGDDIFVQKLDSSGDFVWAKAMGGTSADVGNSIALDVSGDVYTTGYFEGTADFDPSAGTANLTSAGFEDIFVSKLDPAGDFVWAKAMGGTGGDEGSGIAVEASGNVYTTGYFLGNVDFDPGADTAILTSADSDDIFVSKLVNPPVVTAINRLDTNPSNALSLNFEVVFSTPVSGVDVKDFGIDPSGVTGASVTGLTGSDANYTVTISTGTGDGTLSIVVFDDESIVDSLDVPLGGTGTNNGDFTSGEAYTIDKTPPVITPTDPNTTTVEAGVSYVEPGATAMDGLDGEVMVTVGGDTVDPNAPVDTVVTVTYDAVDTAGNNALQATRQVTVVDMTAPIITVTDPGVTTVGAGGSWMEPGATALDGVDGAFAASVGGDVVDPNAPVGTVFFVTYDAVDVAGNDAIQAMREVTVVDTTPPNIVVTDAGLTTVEAGASWAEPGAMALDGVDGAFAASVGGDLVDPNAPVGTVFFVTYDAVDLAGNDAVQATREVTVVDTTPPNIVVSDPGLTTVEAGGSWAEPGATVLDGVDGAFAASVGGDTVDPSAPVDTVFIVTYDAVDIAGNNAMQATREVTVVDTTPPNIIVTDPSLTTVEAGGSWVEPGATVSDTVDGASAATVGGDTVDPSAPVGSVFIVTYDAVDLAGNGATKATREVTVVDTTPPVVDSVVPNPAIPDPTNVAQIRYTVVFTEPVKGVDEDPAGGFDDFAVTTTGLTGAFVESVTGSGGEFSLEFDVRVNTGAGDGTIALDMLSSGNVTDGASNVYTDLLLRTGPDFTIDRSSPTVSIGPPSVPVTASGPIAFEVTYTGADVVTLSASDIVVSGTGTAAAAAPQISGTGNSSRIVKLSDVTGDGSLAITIAPGTAFDVAGNLARVAGPSEAVPVFNTPPTITILGENPLSLFVGQEYVDAGATVMDLFGGDITHLIEVSGTVDSSTPDQYALTYRVRNGFGISAQEIRIVNVFPPPIPVITILGDNPTAIVTGGVYTDAGATAFDEFNGDITDAIQVSNGVDPNTSGQYSVTYTITSPLGVAVMATRVVNVLTQNVPVISITGPNPATVQAGSEYVDAGATATDAIDGDLTASINVDNGVDPNTVGAYIVRYTVTNAAGESASAQRVVNVRAILRPLVFVDAHADSGGDGRSESPFRTITEALTVSSTMSEPIIVVRRGFYPETLSAGDGITLRSEEGAFHTLIDGGGVSGDVVTLGNGSKLIGFTVGNAAGAAVRVLELAEVTVSNNVLHTAAAGLAAEANAVTRFVNNTVYSTGVGVFGAPGAIFRPLKNSIFKGNETAISMDAAAIQGGSFNLFFDNGANFDGPSPADTDLFGDPLFADLAQLNFHLQATSPGRDGGDSNTAFTDIDGSINDLGADGGPQGVRDFEVPLAIIAVVGETTVEAPAVVEFHASASFDEYGIDEFVWDFDQADGLSIDATGEIASQTFDTAGQFIVTLLVTDHSGLQGRARVEVSVSDDGNFPPSGGGTVSPIAGAAPLTVTFSGQGTDPDGGAVTFSWELDDTVFSTEQNPMLTFPEGTPPGSKRVIVTLTDDEGAQTQRLIFVTITAETEETSGIIDPDEETVIMINNTNSLLDATGVTVPTGAADEPIVITISPVEEVVPRFDENFGHLTQLGPTGHVFSRPVTVVIPHAADVLHNDIIEVFWYDEDNQEWRNDGIFNVTHIEGTSLHFVQFETSHFTIFNTSSIIPRTITGVVISEEGDTAIEGASIKLNSEGLEAFTNVDGLYSFVRDFEPGTYELVVAADGFQSETKQYDVSEAAVSKLNFQMKGLETEFPRISLSPSAFNNVLREGETLAVTVSNSGAGTLDWSAAVTNGAEWLSLDISGSSITITAAENTESASRDGSIEVTDPSAANSPVTLAITQAGQDKGGCVGAGGSASITAAWGDVLLLLLLALGLWAHGHFMWAHGHSKGARSHSKRARTLKK